MYEVLQGSEDLSSISYVITKLLGSSVDCGVFTAANAYLLLSNIRPETVVLNQSQLRSHL